MSTKQQSQTTSVLSLLYVIWLCVFQFSQSIPFQSLRGPDIWGTGNHFAVESGRESIVCHLSLQVIRLQVPACYAVGCDTNATILCGQPPTGEAALCGQIEFCTSRNQWNV